MLLRLARELRREIHSLGVTGGQVSLLVSDQAQPRHHRVRARRARAHLGARHVRASRRGSRRRTLIERTRATDRRRIGLYADARGREGARGRSASKRTAWLVARLEAARAGRSASTIEAALPALEKLLRRHEVTLLRLASRADVRLAAAPPQLPPLLRRPADVGRRHVDAEHRDGLARGAARAALARPRGRPAHRLPLRPVHACSACSPASSPTGFDNRRIGDRHAVGADGLLRACSPRSRCSGTCSCGRSTRSPRSTGTAIVFDAPARQNLTFQMVGRDELPNAVALNSSLFNIARIFGPALAGVLIAAVGAGWCFAINTAQLPRRARRPARDARVASSTRSLDRRAPDALARHARGLRLRASATGRCS